jgi:Chloroplast import apparatus Tic20-like
MSGQVSATPVERFFGSVAYLLPIIEVFGFGSFIFEQLPIVQQLYLPLTPLMILYATIQGTGAVSGFSIGSFIFFLALYLGVVQNQQIARFIRFNTLQAILIGILISLCGLTFGVFLPLFGQGAGATAITQVLYNVVFLGTIAACGYSIVMSLLGKYTEIPKLSETAHQQLGRY